MHLLLKLLVVAFIVCQSSSAVGAAKAGPVSHHEELLPRALFSDFNVAGTRLLRGNEDVDPEERALIPVAIKRFAEKVKLYAKTAVGMFRAGGRDKYLDRVFMDTYKQHPTTPTQLASEVRAMQDGALKARWERFLEHYTRWYNKALEEGRITAPAL